MGMSRSLVRALGAGVLALLGLQAQAVSVPGISLVPSSQAVGINQAFTVDVVLNADAAPGNHPGVYWGEITIDFDGSQLSYTGFDTAWTLPAPYTSGPVEGSENGKTTRTVGLTDISFDTTPDQGVIGTFSFLAGPTPGIAPISLADGNNLGSWANQTPLNIAFVPGFSPTSVTVVPLPAAAWLMLGGVGLLGLARRR